MPRAADPDLVGQLPFDHSPLNRMDHRANTPVFNLDAMMEQNERYVTEFLIPLIYDLTGIDLSGWFPFIDGLFTQTPPAKGVDFLDINVLLGNVTQIFADIGTVIDNIVNAWLGLFSSGWTLTDLGDSQDNAAAAMAANAAAIDKLRARLEQANNNGVFVGIDFSTYPDTTSLPTEFSQTDSGPGLGTFGVSSGRAKVTAPGTANRTTRAVYNPPSGVKETFTDYQVIIGIWTSEPGIDLFNRGFYRLRGRCNTAGNTDVYAEFAKDRVTLGCTVAGTTTVFKVVGNGGTGTFTFKTNTSYYFILGTAGGTRSFEVHEGRPDGPIVISHTEAGTTSRVGTLYRQPGLGADWAASPSAAVLPGSLLYYAFADNIDSSVVGSTFRAYRTTTTTAAAAAGTNNSFPGSWYSTTERISPDYLYDASTNTLQVRDEDTYYVTISQRVASDILLNLHWSPVLRHEGTLVRTGPATYQPQGTGLNLVFACTFEVYCEAGDTLSPGYACTQSPTLSLTADTAGTATYWAVSRDRPIVTT